MRSVLMLLLLLPGWALAADKPQPMALTNPGFEDELQGWDNADNPELAGAFALDHDAHHGGKAALHMQSQAPGQWPWVSQRVQKIEPGATYLFRAWHQGGAKPELEAFAALKLEFLNDRDEPLAERYNRRRAMVLQWQALAVEAVAPPAAHAAVVSLRLTGEGEVWFDDAELLRTKQAPGLLMRPERMALKLADQPTAHLEVVAAADLPKDAAARVELLGANDKPVSGVKGALAATGPRTLAGDLSLPPLAPGSYRWRVKLGSLTAEGKLFVSLAERRPENLTQRGVLIVDGKPLFPIGIYHAAVGHYRLLAEQGFNAVQGLGTHAVQQLRTSVQEAQRHKLVLDIPLYVGGAVGANLVPSQQKLSYFAKSAGVAGWKMADEPDQRPELADEVPEVYARLKDRETGRPLGLTAERPSTYPYWAHFCDSLQVVAFPLPEHELGLVAERVAQARKALQPWQHLSVLLQAGWLPGGENQPTLAQARVMVYLAVINGARGIWWYALRDPGWDLTKTKLWPDFKRLNEETAALGAAVVEGVEIDLESSDPALQAAGWRKGNQVRLAVANPRGDGPQTALLKLPVAVEKAEVRQGKAQVEVKEGALQVTVAAGEAALIACTAAAPAQP